MPRPETKRRVSRRLKDRFFKPHAVPMERLELVALSLDGLEALRLADVEGLYQEEAAERMGVSRATFARILSTARRSVADALLNGKAVDIGPASCRQIADAVAGAGTIFWNGPLGVFEKPPFETGTVAVAAAIGAAAGQSVIGGGETVAAASRAGVIDQLSHVSTGGGASLELLAGKTLPGVAALEVS